MASPLIYSGRTKEGLVQTQRAMRLNPLHPEWYTVQLGWAYSEAGQYEEAISVFKRVVNPPTRMHYELAVAYAELGRADEAKAEVAKDLATRTGIFPHHLYGVPQGDRAV